MSEILERRVALHKQVETQQVLNNELKSQIGTMQPLANIGLVSAMIAHEMNNILTPLGNYAELALAYPDDTALSRKALEKTAINSARAAKILESLLGMANGKSQKKQHVNLKECVEQVFSFAGRDFSKDGIKVSIQIDDEIEMFAEEVAVQQVLLNLLLNARHAMLDGGGKLTISAAVNPHDIEILVSDTGHGISPDNLERIFESFYSTKDQETAAKNGGAGLGLAFCKTVIESHNGKIRAESEAGCGATFVITLPSS